MKQIILALTLILSISSISAKSKCGTVSGLKWHHHDHEVGGLSGFYINQSDWDIRVTKQAHGEKNGNINEIMFTDLEQLNNLKSLFICLDDYDFYYKKYSGKTRKYVYVYSYRAWIDGELVLQN